MKKSLRQLIALALTGSVLAAIILSVSYLIENYENLDEEYKPNIQHIQRNLLERFQKTFTARGYNKDSNSWNLELSYEDLKEFSKPFSLALSDNRIFLSDEDKNWRKSDVSIAGQKFKSAKVKISGTSITPFKNSLSWFYKFKLWISGVDVYDPTVVNYSYKVKLKSNKFSNGIRRFTLNTAGDQWDASTIVLTNIAKEWGLIASKLMVEQVFINRVDSGLYLISEDIGKELLEREYRTTNYGIYKSNDEWDKSLNKRHVSFTDYTALDKEQGGMLPASEYGLTKLGQLFNVLDNGDLKELKSRVDLDYFAKISALEILYGNTHSTIGDNVKYIYDFSSGLIYISFRIEGNIKELRGFKSAKGFEKSAEFRHNRNKILQLLTSDAEWVRLRNSYLSQLVKRKKEILYQINLEKNKLVAKSSQTSKLLSKKINNSVKSRKNANKNLKKIKKYLKKYANTGYPIQKSKQKVSTFGNITEKNLSAVKQAKGQNYGTFTKVYATIVKNRDILEVLHISATESYLEEIITCEKDDILKGKKLYLPPTLANKEFQKIEFFELDGSDCIESISISKSGKKIDKRHIHINNRIEINSIAQKFIDFKEIFVGATKIFKEDQEIWKIPKGVYRVRSDIYIPKGINLEISAGSKILLGNDTSILVRGNLHAVGTETDPIIIDKLGNENFGSFAVIGNIEPAIVELTHFHLGNGSEEVLDGIYFSSQMSLHNTESHITSSRFFNSSSDDGLNIKNSKVMMTDNAFFDNFGDQVDLDFCEGIVEKNKFYMNTKVIRQLSETDGLDVSGSKLTVKDNLFENLSDKAVSVGEQSEITLMSNTMLNSNIAVAVKDGSNANILGNLLEGNKVDLTTYIKKLMYDEPTFLSDIELSCRKVDSDFERQKIYSVEVKTTNKQPLEELQSNKCENLM
jgi:hypothetical protein